MIGSPGRRLIAKLIDRIVLGLALVPGGLVALLSESRLAALVVSAGALALVLGFEWWLVSRRGQSPGKYLLGLRIISSEGDEVGFVRGVGQRVWLMGLLGGVLAGVPLVLDPLFVFRADRLCLHDRLAKTKVIVAGSLGDPYASLSKSQ